MATARPPRDDGIPSVPQGRRARDDAAAARSQSADGRGPPEAPYIRAGAAPEAGAARGHSGPQRRALTGLRRFVVAVSAVSPRA